MNPISPTLALEVFPETRLLFLYSKFVNVCAFPHDFEESTVLYTLVQSYVQIKIWFIMVFSIAGAQSLSTVILEPCNSRFYQCLPGLLVLVLCIKSWFIHKYKHNLLVHLMGHKFYLICIFCTYVFVFSVSFFLMIPKV